MRRQGLPIWLLRDFPAFLGVMISFWPLIILVITNGFKAMRGKQVPKSAYDDFPLLLAYAESRLDFALWREAYRRAGWDPRDVEFTLVEASDDWNETARHFQSYQRASRNLEACARAYVHELCERYNIAKRDVAAHGSTDARPCRAAHHELVGVATLVRGASPLALILSSARSARPSKDEHGHTHADPHSLFATRYSPTPHLSASASETAPVCAYRKPGSKNPGGRGPPGSCCSRYPSDQLKPIQRPPAAVATQLRIDITAIILAMRPSVVASSL